MERTSNGRPLHGTQVIAADAIARLAGVDFKSVVKVLLAVHALEVGSGHEARQLVDIDSVPTCAPDDIRYTRTVEYIGDIVHRLQKKPTRHLLDALNVHRRFGAKDADRVLPPTLRAVHGMVHGSRQYATVGNE